MERFLLKYLIDNWLTAVNRKPLLIRGARQVGKTWMVRQLAKVTNKNLIELNFEKQPSYATLFTSNDVQEILLTLSTLSNQKIDPENSLLFLDEIQAAPHLLSKLRWFAEDLPKLPVIAAGSLLEFVLAEHSFSMPVGRISYVYLEPLSFEEFLVNQKKSLYDYLLKYSFNNEIPMTIHEQLSMYFKKYLLIGGLPAVVSNWVTEQSLDKVSQIQNDLLSTYRDDFAKYKGRIAIDKLDEVMMAVPKMLAQKFVFKHVNPSQQSTTIKHILNLLEKAKVCHRVSSCSGNGIPLASEIKDKKFKEIFLDIGLCSTALGLNLNQINKVNEIDMVNNGGIAEQVVGQILRTINKPYHEPALYYWHREEPGSDAEIDYIIQHGDQVIPIEVKAGSTGSLKSLHLFMGLKKLPIAIRINSDLPNKSKLNLKDNMGNQLEYILLSIPFYLTGQIHRLLAETNSR